MALPKSPSICVGRKSASRRTTAGSGRLPCLGPLHRLQDGLPAVGGGFPGFRARHREQVPALPDGCSWQPGTDLRGRSQRLARVAGQAAAGPAAQPDRVAWPGTGPGPQGRSSRVSFSAPTCARACPSCRAEWCSYLRVFQLDYKTYSTWNKTYRHSGPPVSIVQEEGVKRILSEVPVEADGSVHFKAPAGHALFFQLLDAGRRCVQTMRSFTGLMPGEQRGCVGCHEGHSAAPPRKEVWLCSDYPRNSRRRPGVPRVSAMSDSPNRCWTVTASVPSGPGSGRGTESRVAARAQRVQGTVSDAGRTGRLGKSGAGRTAGVWHRRRDPGGERIRPE